MPVSAGLSLNDRRQRTVLRVGAVYDAGFGVALLAVPALITRTLALPFPDVGEIWLRLDGIFLIVVGMIYIVMAQNPARYLGVFAMILPAKIGSIIFYLTYVFGFGASKTFVLFAFLDAVMFALHWWALGAGGIARIRESLRAAPAGVT